MSKLSIPLKRVVTGHLPGQYLYMIIRALYGMSKDLHLREESIY
jgi:hypothetical protein